MASRARVRRARGGNEPRTACHWQVGGGAPRASGSPVRWSPPSSIDSSFDSSTNRLVCYLVDLPGNDAKTAVLYRY